MRVIAVQTLRRFIREYPKSKQAILSWYEEAEKAAWGSPNDLKKHYHHASIISDKRVVFNLHGNSYRLVVDIEYRLKIVFVVWFGTHSQYDKMDIKKIAYDKANKK